MRLFVCDDNPHYRTLIRIMLGNDYEIVGEASDGEEAIALAPAAAPDVLLLDLNMPKLGGHAALPVLRRALPEAAIVVLTSGPAQDERQRALAAGADGFIVKPESIFALSAALDAALDASSGPAPRPGG